MSNTGATVRGKVDPEFLVHEWVVAQSWCSDTEHTVPSGNGDCSRSAATVSGRHCSV